MAQTYILPSYNSKTSEVSFHFKYPNTTNPVLIKLKELADITLYPTADELERAKTILGYTHKLFIHNGDNQPSAIDPVTIITEAKAGKEFRCVEYSLLGAALLWAHAIQARVVGLKTEDVETREYGAGHVVVEYWSKDYQKWIMCDVQAGIIPTSDNTPLSALELGEKVNQSQPIDYIPVSRSRFSTKASFTNMKEYTNWVKEYLYFYDTPIAITFADIDLRTQQLVMLVPLGVKPPKLFQNSFVMNTVKTHSVLDFYPNISQADA